MARNSGRKKSNAPDRNSRKTADSTASPQEQSAGTKPARPDKEILFQVKTKRDSAVIKAYITFTYRVLHPGVTERLIIFGIMAALPAIIIHQTWLRITCLVLGALLILLGLFRQYISLALTGMNDEAYKRGTEFTYDFTLTDARFYSDDKLTSSISKYKEIISFYYDDDFYYLGIRNRDFFILPKSRFTMGNPDEFEDFIYKRCKKTCRWIPSKLSDRIRLRRASRIVRSEREK